MFKSPLFYGIVLAALVVGTAYGSKIPVINLGKKLPGAQ